MYCDENATNVTSHLTQMRLVTIEIDLLSDVEKFRRLSRNLAFSEGTSRLYQ
jgi:hypothetical protein